MRALRLVVARFLAVAVLLLRWSCRVRVHLDPRPALKETGEPYVYAILHCHQLGAVVSCEPGTGAMVSRSADGDLLVPALRLHGIVPFRGSSSREGVDKGGPAALDALIAHVRGGAPGYLAVDGPRGPRSFVHRGIARLAAATDAAVLVAIPVPRARWLLSRTWDRFQIPRPFTRVDVFFGAPLRLGAGETLESFCDRIGDALAALERRHDPAEARRSAAAARWRRPSGSRSSRGGP